ncbi:hypothetical protein [Sulfurovum sp.]|uniref:hypothetical protein n=1 Tax=Sulfurovum sp. TaxID=1969726 RepID=UPI002A35B4C1|nr:hypothetical protein [Sulfurovum sp.]MDY0403776.1 hypothetical protein [Sulfurovum sp.]
MKGSCAILSNKAKNEDIYAQNALCGEQSKALSTDAKIRPQAAFSASGMNKNEHGVIGGVRVGTAFNAMTGEAITDINGVRHISMGTKTEANIGDTGDIGAQISREIVEHGLNPKKAIAAGAGALHNQVSDTLQDAGMSEDTANTTATGASLFGAAAAAAGMTEAGQRIYNLKTGKLVAKEDFTYTNGKGEEEKVEKGKEFDLSKNQALKEHLEAHPKIKVGAQKGFPAKVASGAIEKYDRLVGGKSSDEPLDSSNSGTNDIQNNQPDSKVEGEPDNKIKHNEPPFSSSESSIAQNGAKPNLASANATAIINSVTGNKDIKSKAAADRALKAIDQISDEDAGRLRLKNDLMSHFATLDTSTPEGKELAIATNTAISAVDSGKTLTPTMLKKAGFTEAEAKQYVPKTVNGTDYKSGKP